MKTIPERNMNCMDYSERKNHVKNWSDFRIEAMNEAENIYGKLNKDNLKDIQKHMKSEEKKWKLGLR